MKRISCSLLLLGCIAPRQDPPPWGQPGPVWPRSVLDQALNEAFLGRGVPALRIEVEAVEGQEVGAEHETLQLWLEHALGSLARFPVESTSELSGTGGSALAEVRASAPGADAPQFPSAQPEVLYTVRVALESRQVTYDPGSYTPLARVNLGALEVWLEGVLTVEATVEGEGTVSLLEEDFRTRSSWTVRRLGLRGAGPWDPSVTERLRGETRGRVLNLVLERVHARLLALGQVRDCARSGGWLLACRLPGAAVGDPLQVVTRREGEWVLLARAEVVSGGATECTARVREVAKRERLAARFARDPESFLEPEGPGLFVVADGMAERPEWAEVPGDAFLWEQLPRELAELLPRR